MATRFRRQSPFSRLVLPAVLLALTGYFGWHAQVGDYGIEARARFQATLAELGAEYDALLARRAALEAEVDRMRPATLDADLLEERARAKLNLAREGELIFLDQPRGSGSR